MTDPEAALGKLKFEPGRGATIASRIARLDLSTTWERTVVRTAIVFAVLTLAVLVALSIGLIETGVPLWISIPAAAAIGWAVYYWMTRKLRRRRQILSEPFPPEWETILLEEVAFFRALREDERGRFRRELQVFIGEKLITGIKVSVGPTTRVLVGASAVIPIFGFPEWEWDQINEVLVYPNRFDEEFAFEGDSDRRTLGVVGTGALNGVMILSKPDLLAGFRNPGDKRNVGLHEFAHLVDKSDGDIDGLPAVGLEQSTVGPWIELVRRKMSEMQQGRSDINAYGLSNESEFFAVATEYFFERPGVMERKHPELYSMLAKVFRQTPSGQAALLAGGITGGRRRLGRNSPCPCGSGLKYKKCCLA